MAQMAPPGMDAFQALASVPDPDLQSCRLHADDADDDDTVMMLDLNDYVANASPAMSRLKALMSPDGSKPLLQGRASAIVRA